jgi:autotransporter-associated beta strand protein
MVLLAAGSTPHIAGAATRTWTGAVSGNWATASNWNGGLFLPVNGDDLIFPAVTPTSRRVMTNNFSNVRTFRSLTFEEGSYFLRGQSIGVTETVTSTSSAGLSELEIDISLGGQVAMTINSGAFYMSGVLDGTGGITKEGLSTLFLTGSSGNSFVGPTIIHAGTLALGKSSGFALSGSGLSISPTGASATARYDDNHQMPTLMQITIDRGGLLNLNNHNGDVGNLTLTAGRVETGTGQLQLNGSVTAAGDAVVVSISPPVINFFSSTIAGNLNLASADRQFIVNPSPLGSADPDLDITALVSGSSLVKTGNGEMRMSGNNTFSGAARVQAGSVVGASSGAFGASSGGVFVSGTGQLVLDGNLSINNESLELNNPDDLPAVLLVRNGASTWSGAVSLVTTAYVDVATSATLNLNGIVSGPGTLAKVGNGTLGFFGSGNNTFNGATLAKDGLIVMDREIDAALGIVYTVVPHNLLIESGCTVRLIGGSGIAAQSAVTILAGGTLDINMRNQQIGSLEGAGSVTLGATPAGGTSKFGIGGNGQSTTFSGLISQSGVPLIKNGGETLRLTANNSYSSQTRVEGGVLVVNGSQTNSPVTLAGGTLSGTGKVGAITGAGGILSPGDPIGKLTTIGNLSLTANDIFRVQLRNTNAGPSDQLDVFGTSSAHGAYLQLQPVGLLENNQIYTILLNHSGTIMITKFGNALSDATCACGNIFNVNYYGGDGNDVDVRRTGEDCRPIVQITRQQLDPATLRFTICWSSSPGEKYDLQYALLGFGDSSIWSPFVGPIIAFSNTTCYQFDRGIALPELQFRVVMHCDQ